MTTHRKIILDSTNYTGKPIPLRLANGQPFPKCITNGYFWQRHVTLNAAGECIKCDENGAGVPVECGCRYLVRWAMQQGAEYLVLDLEGAEATLANLTQTLAWVHNEIARLHSHLKVSVYTLDGDDSAYPDRFANGTMKPEWRAVLNSLNFITPSFYGYRDLTQAGWMNDWYAGVSRIMKATRALTSHPILPFISPRYWDGGQYVPAGSIIPVEPFRAMVTTLLSRADGFTVWDPGCSLQGPEVAGVWDDAAPWWQIVRGAL